MHSDGYHLLKPGFEIMISHWLHTIKANLISKITYNSSVHFYLLICKNASNLQMMQNFRSNLRPLNNGLEKIVFLTLVQNDLSFSKLFEI